MTTTPVPASAAPAPTGPVPGAPLPGQQPPSPQPDLHQAPTDRLDPLAHPAAGPFPFPDASGFSAQGTAKPSFGAQMGARSTEFKNALIAGGVGIAVAFLAAGFGLGYWAGDAGSSSNTPQSGFSQMGGGGRQGTDPFGGGQFGGGQFGGGQFGGSGQSGTGTGTGTQGGSLGGGQTQSGTGAGTGTTTG